MEKSSQIHFKREKSSKKLAYARTSDFCNQRSLIRCKNFEHDDIIKSFLPQIGLQLECATWLPETREKKPVKAGTGRGRFEISRFQVS